MSLFLCAMSISDDEIFEVEYDHQSRLGTNYKGEDIGWLIEQIDNNKYPFRMLRHGDKIW